MLKQSRCPLSKPSPVEQVSVPHGRIKIPIGLQAEKNRAGAKHLSFHCSRFSHPSEPPCAYCCHIGLSCVLILIGGLWLGLHGFRCLMGVLMMNAEAFDTGMIYSTGVTEGVLCRCHPQRCLPSRLICIHSISAPTMTHTTNEVPAGQESAWLTVRYCFILHCKHVHSSSPKSALKLYLILQYTWDVLGMFLVTEGHVVVWTHCTQKEKEFWKNCHKNKKIVVTVLTVTYMP